jgi:hypothetical protein
MYVCIHIYIYMYVYTYTYIHIYIHKGYMSIKRIQHSNCIESYGYINLKQIKCFGEIHYK